jgi:ABC-type nitrate/sulfonate/bicarbonate transport system substrate-binding protein
MVDEIKVSSNFASMEKKDANPIKCGGVPEHFCYPWRQLSQENAWKNRISWHEYEGGTGAMTQALVEGELDLAILLTEGAIRAVEAHPDIALFARYVENPLKWGVHAAVDSEVKKDDLEGVKFAVSRMNSGSHLMAYLYAEQHGLSVDNIEFEVVGNMTGAEKALPQDHRMLFLWEKATTQPLVDKGVFKRIDVFSAFWSAFVVVVRKDVLSQRQSEVNNILHAIRNTCEQLTKKPNIVREIANEYTLDFKEVEDWYSGLRWSETGMLDQHELAEVRKALIRVGVLK